MEVESSTCVAPQTMATNAKSEACGACGRSSQQGALKICSGCRSAYFCGADCFRKAWNAGHKKVCKVRTKEKPTPYNYTVDLAPEYIQLIESQCGMPFCGNAAHLDSLGARLNQLDVVGSARKERMQKARAKRKDKKKSGGAGATHARQASANSEAKGGDSDDEEIAHEFGFSWTFDPRWLEQCALRGIFPMAIPMGTGQGTSVPLMAPKLHKNRCVFFLQGGAEGLKYGQTQSLHIGRRDRKRGSKLFFTIDNAFEGVISLCLAEHGENWLYPKLRHAFEVMHKSPDKYTMRLVSFEVWAAAEVKSGDVTDAKQQGGDENQGEAAQGKHTSDDAKQTGRQLVAGELGFCIGDTYTSLTGATAKGKASNGAGSLQMVCMAAILQRCGFALWDLGMPMQYKLDMGAVKVPRESWQALATAHAKRATLPVRLPDSLRQAADASSAMSESPSAPAPSSGSSAPSSMSSAPAPATSEVSAINSATNPASSAVSATHDLTCKAILDALLPHKAKAG